MHLICSPCILPVYLGVSLFLNLYYLSKKKIIYTPKDACRERLLPWSKQLNWHPCLHHQLQLWNHGYLDVLLWLRNQGSNFLLSVFTYTALLNHAKKNNPILDIIFVCVCVCCVVVGAQCSLKHKSFQNYWPTKTIILNTLQVDEYLNQIVSIWLISNSECEDIWTSAIIFILPFNFHCMPSTMMNSERWGRIPYGEWAVACWTHWQT